MNVIDISMAGGRVVIPSAREQGGDSGAGMSYWLPSLGCDRRDYLKRNLPMPIFDSEEEEKANEARVGKLVHQLLEYYHSGIFDRVALEYADGAFDASWVEALRLFRVYRQKHAVEEFGVVVGCEVPFEFTDDKAIEHFGVPRFTGRIDMIVRTPEDVGPMVEKWPTLLGIEPSSLYNFDTKTSKQHNSNLVIVQNESTQFAAYAMAQEINGTPVRGTIANCIFRHKELEDDTKKSGSSFVKILVPAPDQRMKTVVKQTLTHAKWLRDMLGHDRPNPARCFDYFKTCPFLNVHCDRTH